MRGIIGVLLIALLSIPLITSCSQKENSIDFQRFMEKRKQDNSVNPERAKEAKKSIFPNLKGD